MNRYKKAFTLLELIFVIVVLGIVLGIVAEIVAKMYGGYIEAKTNDRLQSKTELAAQQIANRLSYRVNPTVVATDGTNRVELKNYDETTHSNYTILEWIGRDFVGFRGKFDGTMYAPAWSGFIDLYHSNTNATGFTTPSTRPQTLNELLNAQSFGKVSLMGASKNRPAVIFRGRMDDFDIERYYNNVVDNNSSSHYVYPVECVPAGCDDSNPRLKFVRNYSDGNSASHSITLYEHYDFVWSAYALVPEGDQLVLHYNYQPWLGERYDDASTSRAVLLDGLQTFRFTQVGEVIRVKVCASESDGDQNLTVCKEKAIL